MRSLLAAGEQLLSRAAHALEHHPKHITALLAAVLLGGGGGAFAVASLGPDPAALPVRQVLEAVEPLPLHAQSEALQVHSFNVFTSETVRPTDTVDSLLARLGINDPAAAAYLRQENAVRQQRLGVAGRTVVAEATDDRNLVRLSSRWPIEHPTLFKRAVVERQASGRFGSRVELAPLTASLRLGTGTIQTSLYAAVDEAGIPDAVTTQLAEIFAGDIDFHRGLRRGDRFHVVYETLEADGEPLRTGRVISAEFVNAGRVKQAMWFQEHGTTGGYFDFKGESLERSFLASPMTVSRVTSGFAMRFHPVLHAWRAHKGVDYGAPTGTPVRSIGDGRVEFAGWMGGYGNVVQVDHGGGDSTVYAHLSRIDVRTGAPVQRGQRIGAVGATGWATGPHLHFEFRENGVQRDPIEVARQSQARTLSAQARPEFEQAARALRAQLAAAANTTTRHASAR
jgi:murein DD-endopeptidase MepM/ murein hydrolase activator NlpD